MIRVFPAFAFAACIENNFAPVTEPGATFLSDSGGPSVGRECDAPVGAGHVRISFPSRVDCPWGVGDNLWQQNEFNQARVEETAVVGVPAGAELCSVRLRSTTEDLMFDDHVTIALGGVVLVGGGSGYAIDALPRVDGLYRYDWSALAGTPFADRSAPYWCLGGSESTCVVPSTEVLGSLELDIGGAALGELAAALTGVESVPLTLVTFGDDDEDDCAHTALELDVDTSWIYP